MVMLTKYTVLTYLGRSEESTNYCENGANEHTYDTPGDSACSVSALIYNTIFMMTGVFVHRSPLFHGESC